MARGSSPSKGEEIAATLSLRAPISIGSPHWSTSSEDWFGVSFICRDRLSTWVRSDVMRGEEIARFPLSHRRARAEWPQ